MDSDLENLKKVAVKGLLDLCNAMYLNDEVGRALWTLHADHTIMDDWDGFDEGDELVVPGNPSNSDPGLS